MDKVLFLEYKFRDFTDEEILLPKLTGVMAAFERLTSDRISQIRRLGFDFGVSFVCTPDGNICPLKPSSIKFCEDKVEKIIRLLPDIIWFDYLMFPGKWNVQKDKAWKVGIHNDCKYCKGKNRQMEVAKLAKEYVLKIPKHIKTGYYSMPFELGEFGNWESKLGQDNRLLGNVFDYVSPMLYHRMIKQTPIYISQHVKYLNSLTIKGKILPIIQLKDMPDHLEDGLTVQEFGQAVNEAIKPPSAGIAVFSWDQAIEKDKLVGASKILRDL